ncbi:Nucleosome remodeling factor, subunit CAF1/NURF55/MSI1 [Phytophthora cinnamomi]|uniref:Nucleosome remodeling factor, subunit CAF1/NURF55/MSI1 n=1 Tax=Phytophthora cinnamomi TaxID=4785 RepID=UPI00355A839A|nr:Nucleosome remodeling factor, subunit CAF1/NURF55/MSI1 [Phytophthora cinnamomi]
MGVQTPISVSPLEMPSILDFFKPLRQDKRAREDAAATLSNQEPPPAASTPPRSPTTAVTSKRNAANPNEKSQPNNNSAPPAKRQATQSNDQPRVIHQEPLPSVEPVYAVDRPVGLSEYEQKRQAKMAANAKFLEELGITSAQLDITRQLQINSRQRKDRVQRQPKPKRQLKEAQPVRRSRRLRGETAPGSAPPPRVIEDEGYESSGPDSFEVEASFAESNVLRYSVNENKDTRKEPPSSTMNGADRELVGFQVDPKSYLHDANLAKAYDISFTDFKEHGLVAAGGHGGHVSIFPFSNSYHQPEIVDGFVDDPGAHIPLMSFKAHRGWVAAVSLAKSVQGRANVLLSASNDGSVKLWDLNKSSNMLRTPKEIFTSTSLHQKGIFGMDVCGDSVLTCSKDATIALSMFRCDNGSLEVVRRFEDHDGVVKCTRFAKENPQLFASGGNDKAVRVFDVRVATDPKVIAIEGMHYRAINSVQFHPTDENLLLSAGFDTDFYMFDLRKASAPVCTFRRSPQSKDNGRAIFHPIFVCSGRGVVAARGQDLSLYKTSDGIAISRGYVSDASTCIAADPFHDRIAIAQGGHIRFADAQWKH